MRCPDMEGACLWGQDLTLVTGKQIGGDGGAACRAAGYCIADSSSPKLERYMKTEYSEGDLLRAKKWYADHKKHVNALMKGCDESYPASGSDICRPDLWKPAMWNYFFGA